MQGRAGSASRRCDAYPRPRTRKPSSSATICASTVRVPVPMSCAPVRSIDRAVAAECALRKWWCRVDDVHPLRLRHADAALDGPGVGARGSALRPAEALGADAPLDFARARVVGVVRVDPVAQRERIHAECVGQLVERLLEREDPCTCPGARKAAAGAGVREHVVVLGGYVRDGYIVSVAEADAGARGHAARAVALELAAPSAVPSRFAPSLRRWRLLGRLPTLTCSSRRSSMSRTGARALRDRWIASSAVVADAELRAEAAAGELADDADLFPSAARTRRPPRRAR